MTTKTTRAIFLTGGDKIIRKLDDQVREIKEIRRLDEFNMDILFDSGGWGRFGIFTEVTRVLSE